jgi:hypothetical protein
MTKEQEVSYDEKRKANIERNNAFLKNLGLDGVKPEAQATKKRRPAKRRSNEDFTAEGYIPPEPTRRSSRVKELPPMTYKEVASSSLYEYRKSARILDQPFDVDYTEEYIPEADIREFSPSKRPSSRKVPRVKYDDHDDSTQQAIEEADEEAEAAPAPDEKNKSKFLKANLEHFLSNEVLCADIDCRTKMEVMVLASQNRHVRFSKYSGVVEWGNCVFLWVNVPAPGIKPDYPNKFREGGRIMSWFGGSKMHSATSVVARMQRPKTEVMLFVRFDKASYTCLGRLGVEKTVLDAHPISFVWRLLDWERLKDIPYFQEVLLVMGE